MERQTLTALWEAVRPEVEGYPLTVFMAAKGSPVVDQLTGAVLHSADEVEVVYREPYTLEAIANEWVRKFKPRRLDRRALEQWRLFHWQYAQLVITERSDFYNRETTEDELAFRLQIRAEMEANGYRLVWSG